MKKAKRKLTLAMMLILLALGWSWRYNSLNSQYIGLLEEQRLVYRMGEVVPFEEDYIDQKIISDGYLVRVDSFNIVSYNDFLIEMGVLDTWMGRHPERVAVVYATLFNDDSDADGVVLTDFILHGIDNYANVDYELLLLANPALGGNLGISLPQGMEYPVILPFGLYSQFFGADTWENITEYDWNLHITSYPTEKDIAVNCRTVNGD